MKLFKEVISALLGPAQARAAHSEALRNNPSIACGIRILASHTDPDETDDDSPIFLLSAGWRSGSTMLQRLIMSDSRVLVWGEPYDECGIIQALAETTRAFRPEWPPDDYYYDGSLPSTLSGNWIANLFPALEDLRKGHRAILDTLFAAPARRAGVPRWGIKEVRLGVEHAHYLRWLYPNARFILLYRNPLNAYRSYTRYGRNWYKTFPDEPVFTPTRFGAHWRDLMEGYLRDADKLGAMLVRYEDLVGEHPPLGEIESYLDISIDPAVLDTKVGSSERGDKPVRVGGLEKWLLRRAVSPQAQELGYEW